MPTKKIFLGYEIGTAHARNLKRTFNRIFAGWDRKDGGLPARGVNSQLPWNEVREYLSERCGIFDLTGAKRPADNGINLNVVLELGIALGMKRPVFAFYNSRKISRRMVEKRLGDLKGEHIFEYYNSITLKEHLKEAREYFLATRRR